jgi:hypothetical protein
VERLKTWEPASAHSPAPPNTSGLPLYVVASSVEGTRRAIGAAAELSRGLDMRLVILAAQIVPFPLDLEHPAVSADFTRDELSELAFEQGTDVAVKICLCRDRAETIRKSLPPGSLVLIGAPRRWWPNRERALARVLRRDGHRVLLITPKKQTVKSTSRLPEYADVR